MENRKANILIVDDEKGLRIGTQRLLQDEGYLVDTAENGASGIKLALEKDFDLAIIDLKMPDFDGLEVLRVIKASKPNTVCFIATAYASYETAIQSTRLGSFGYIPKPFTPEELISQVELGIKQRKLIVDSEKLKKERDENLLEIASEKSRLNTIVKSISDGVLVVNRVGEIVFYNYAALKYLNISELKIGNRAESKLPKKILDLVNKILSSDKILLKTFTLQLELLPENQLVVEAACTPVPHPDGSILGVAIIISNITQFKQIEHIKSQFVSMVAHELKTPLAAVQGFLNILLDDSIETDKEKEKDYLNRSITRLNGLKDLVNDLLDISRMELKTKIREIEEIHLQQVVQNSIQMLEFEIAKKKISVAITLEKELPVIKADVNEISRMITNLVSNAVKYNCEGGKIFIDASAKNNYVWIRIKDSGIGMKPEEKSRLFTEFYRIKNEKTRGISGTGLGLTIVKRIVDSYHGKIEVESEFGTGTAFTVYLPINTN